MKETCSGSYYVKITSWSKEEGRGVITINDGKTYDLHSPPLVPSGPVLMFSIAVRFVNMPPCSRCTSFRNLTPSEFLRRTCGVQWLSVYLHGWGDPEHRYQREMFRAGGEKSQLTEEMDMKIFTDPPRQSVRGFRQLDDLPCAR